MASWFNQRSVEIRDDGVAPFDGERDKKGELVRDEFGEVKAPAHNGRPAWPARTFLKSKPIMTGDDMNEINRLTAKIELVGKAAEAENLNVKADFEIYVPAIIQFAVMGKGFGCDIKTEKECKTPEEFEAANTWEDPTTRPDYTDEENDGTPGTGKMMQWPDSIEERIKVAAKVPLVALQYFSYRVQELMNSPLPGSKAVES